MKIGNLEVYGVIYKITNKLNGKVYIGQTTNKKGVRGRYGISAKSNLVEGIYKYHLYIKNGGKRNYNKHLFCSIEKYGFNNFEVAEIFDFAFSKRELDIKENMYITIYNSINNGYNNKEGGSRGKNTDEVIKRSIETQIKRGQTRHIYQMSVPDLKIIKEFPSIASATKEIGLTRSAIKNVLNPKYNRSLTAGGYAWSYIDKENEKYKNIDCFMTKADKEREIIELYEDCKNINYIVGHTLYTYQYVYDTLRNNNYIISKKDIIHSNAIGKRKKVLDLYLSGVGAIKIINITGYSKSIVEKAINKYRQGLIDKNGNKIN